MRKSLAIIAIICLSTFYALGQRSYLYNKYYVSQINSANCSLKLIVRKGKKDSMTLIVNKQTYKGQIVRNNIDNEQETYNFYYLPKSQKKFLMIQFLKKDDDYKATIINQEYAQMFKPCFDEKYIGLEFEKQ